MPGLAQVSILRGVMAGNDAVESSGTSLAVQGRRQGVASPPHEAKKH